MSAAQWEVNVQKLYELLPTLGFAYEKRRDRWVGHGVTVKAGAGLRCGRVWLHVHGRGVIASIYVTPGDTFVSVDIKTTAQEPLPEDEVLRLYRLAVSIAREVSKIEPRC